MCVTSRMNVSPYQLFFPSFTLFITGEVVCETLAGSFLPQCQNCILPSELNETNTNNTNPDDDETDECKLFLLFLLYPLHIIFCDSSSLNHVHTHMLELQVLLYAMPLEETFYLNVKTVMMVVGMIPIALIHLTTHPMMMRMMRTNIFFLPSARDITVTETPRRLNVE